MVAKSTISKAKGTYIFKKMLEDKRALQKIADTATSKEDYLKKIAKFNKKRIAVDASI